MTDERAVNTVADVAFALLFITAAIGLISADSLQDGNGHDPLDADRTVAVVGSSTVNVSYSLGPTLDSARSELGTDESGIGSETSGEQPIRITHGSIAEQAGDAAVANLTRSGDDGERLAVGGERYAEALDERVRSRLVGSQFETRLTAVWRPYEGAPYVGTVTLGADPPPEVAVSTAELTIPSGVDPVRERTLEAADGGSYDDVAEIVASAVIEAYLPAERSRYALEGGGVERTLALYRYERMAAIIDGASPDAAVLEASLRRHHAEPKRANEYLASELAGELAVDMSARFSTPSAAARALSTGSVTVAVSTWEP